MNIHRLNSYPLRRPESPRSPKAEVGEIDTRAPFQSVKAAVSLFGEVAISKDRRTPRKSRLSSESVIDKETQLLLAQKELNSIKQNLDSADTTKAKALADLERAKRTVQDLTVKLKTAKDSKQAALEATAALNDKGDHLEQEKSMQNVDVSTQKQELDVAREQYIASAAELDSAKQALNKIRQDFDSALEAKSLAFQQAAEAQRSAKAQSDKAAEVSKEIAAIKEAIQELAFDTQQAREEHEEIVAEKSEVKQGYLLSKRERTEMLEALMEDYDPELVASLEKKLAGTYSEVESVQEEMKKAHASEMDSVRIVTTELNEATRTMQQVAEQESSLRNLVSFLIKELEDVKREQAEIIRQEEAEREAMVIQNTSDAIDETAARLEQLSSEAETARKEAEKMAKDVEDLKREAEAAQVEMEGKTKRLEGLLTDAEEAKLAEKAAVDGIKEVSKGGPESAPRLKVSTEELDALTRKLEECSNTAEMKVAGTTAELEVITANRSEVDKKLEAALKAIEEIKEATEIALKSAEASEEAKKVVEGELRKWKEDHHQTAAA